MAMPPLRPISGIARQTGTFLVDGLFEGPCTDPAGLTARLENWIRLARTAGYRFSLEIEGDAFSLLGDSRPALVPEHLKEISEPLCDLLQQLVDSFAPEERRALFSTVRTVEYGEGTETQSLYGLDAAGVVEVQQRVVDAETVAAEKPLTGKEKVRAGILSLLVLAAVFGISSIFIDYHAFFTKAWRKITPVNTEVMEVETGPFDAYLKVKELAPSKDNRRLVLTLERGPAFPADLPAIEALLARPGLRLSEREALGSLARGYVRVELFGPKDKYQGTAEIRVAGLRDEKTVSVTLLFSREEPPERLVLSW